jgi:hypothetical protein
MDSRRMIPGHLSMFLWTYRFHSVSPYRQLRTERIAVMFRELFGFTGSSLAHLPTPRLESPSPNIFLE